MAVIRRVSIIRSWQMVLDFDPPSDPPSKVSAIELLPALDQKSDHFDPSLCEQPAHDGHIPDELFRDSPSAIPLSVEEVCGESAAQSPQKKRRGGYSPINNSLEALKELEQLSHEKIKRLARVIHGNLCENARIGFDVCDVEQEIYLLIEEMRRGKVRCNLKSHGNTEGYFLRLIVNDLNRRGRVIMVESDRKRDNEASRGINAAARAVIYLDSFADREGEDSLIDRALIMQMRPQTPEEHLAHEQSGAFLRMVRQQMPLTYQILRYDDPGDIGRRMSVNERRSVMLRELMPWMDMADAIEIADELSRKRGKRGSYYRKLIKNRQLVREVPH